VLFTHLTLRSVTVTVCMVDGTFVVNSFIQLHLILDAADVSVSMRLPHCECTHMATLCVKGSPDPFV